MSIFPNSTSTALIYAKITAPSIVANLIQFGTLLITHGYQQNLLLNPGAYSIDPDSDTFNATNWNYDYYCRIYDRYSFPNINGTLLTIDDSRIDSLNPSCFANQSRNGSELEYHGSILSPKSSLIILAGSFSSNETYQIMVHMTHRQNSSLTATGYVIVHVEETHSPLIAVACVISTMCIPNVEYQYMNPTTQAALFSVCVNNCSKADSISWNIYQGSVNVSSNVTQWSLFNQMNIYRDIWFFGMNTNNFTATSQLFLTHPSITYWRFEVVYWFGNRSSASALNFIMNQPPSNGSCSISPSNGTISTLFTISCSNWFDEDGIKDYSFYGWRTDQSDRVMIAFSMLSTNEVLLSGTNENGSLLHIVANIRDIYDCVTEYNISSVFIESNFEEIESFMNSTNNSFISMLASGNQNRISQIITSLSHEFNKINDQAIENALINGIPISTISISSLNSKTQQTSLSGVLNTTIALIEYNKQLNKYANARDLLIRYMTNLSITTIESIKLQSSSLAQFTKATNQLTRNSLTIVSNKCYELALALQMKSTRISSDDVQIVGRYLSECINNVLSSVNGPLQVRTSILDKDWSDANDFPIDYDTDLDSEWSNPNLFADKNDFSWETIEKGRNNYYQKQLSKTIHNKMSETISLISNTMKTHLNLGQNMTINCSSIFYQMEIILNSSLLNKRIEQTSDAHIIIPSSIHLINNNHSIISLRSIVQSLALSDDNGLISNTNLSRSISLTILDHNGNEIPITTDLNDRIELIIPRDPNLQIPSMTLQNVTTSNGNTSSSSSSSSHNQMFNLHFVKYAQSRWNNNRSVALMFEMKPLNESIGYLLIYRFDQSPQLNNSISLLDGWTYLCPSNLTSNKLYEYFLNNQQTFGHQSIIYGLRELNSTEYEITCTNQSLNNLLITDQRFNFSSNYELRTYTSCCYYLDNKNIWQTQGLLVGSETNHKQTQCLSTHLTTFAGGFLVLPSPINWNYVFANGDFVRNKTIYLTIICICIFYILIIIYAHYKDKKDLEKLGVTPLADNCHNDQYFYQILVFTGHRKDAGTDSKVHFIIVGNEDETNVRQFDDGNRKILQRGGIDAFILSVPKSLGSLNYIRIWHNNSGEGGKASWFLKYLIIRDLQTMEKSYFICQQWFGVEKDDGRIERILPIAGDLQKQEFSYLLSKQAYHSMSEGHLWFSIFSRPPSNKFTRVQRCTCCFVLLFTSMLLNILYYDQMNNAKANQITGSLSFGPLLVTREQIGIGIIVELLSFIPSLLLIELFRRISLRQCKDDQSPLYKTLVKLKQEPIKKIELKTKKQRRLIFPWWCIFIAYGLSFLIIIVSSFFIIVRGIEFGDVKIQKWLTSLVSGFFSSILLIQPLKIIALAIFFAFFIRKSDKDKEAAEYFEDGNDFNLNSNEEYLHSSQKVSSLINRNGNRNDVNRLNEDELINARDIRLKEIRMWEIIRETLNYICYLTLIYLITYSNINSNAFFQVNHLEKFFLNSRQSDIDYRKISTIDNYWNWLERSFVSNIRAQEWYNGNAARNLSGFINDKSNRLIGRVLMRQLRVKKNLCFSKISSKCNEDYNLLNEEKQSFQIGWINEINLKREDLNSSIEQAFIYELNNKFDQYMYTGNHATYSSNGFIYEYRGRLNELQSNLSELHRWNWIDQQTRAILIQLTLYNPNIDLFTSGIFLTEFLSTGGLISQYRFEPSSFQIFTSTFQLICTIIYMLFVIYNMIHEIRRFLHLKCSYFHHFWSYVDVGIIGCSWGVLGVYIWRYHQSISIGNRFRETNGYVYINLQLTNYINDVLTYLLGFCCFFGTLKFLRLCRFHRRLSLFTKTLEHARRDLISFLGMFSFVFMAFLALFYLLFIGKLWSCSTLLHTAQMLFEMMLMKFDAHELQDAAPFLGPFVFSLFILLIVFVCMSMFVTIVNDSFRTVRDIANGMPNEDEVVLEYMIQKFRQWIGLRWVNGGKQPEQKNFQMP
ncbi:hypothetical protein I4U23_013233 [Adineta vaga]|nr:hypothetical protein I4U23_013233 [Adineta vaga]